MKVTCIIEGTHSTRHVWVNGKFLDPKHSQALINHSPDGFEWGYGGSGPSQLALSICMELFDQTTALWIYQQFKREHIATLEQGKDFDIFIDINTEDYEGN